MRKILLCLACLGLLSIARAQQQNVSVLAPGGTTARGQTLNLDWTLGELSIRSLSTPAGMLTEGFHQPLLEVKAIGETPDEHLTDQVPITVAPNPVRSLLSVRVGSEAAGVVIDLWDARGKHLRRFEADRYGESLEWDMSSLPAAMYGLSFRTKAGKLLRTFKVTKIN